MLSFLYIIFGKISFSRIKMQEGTAFDNLTYWVRYLTNLDVLIDCEFEYRTLNN